MLRDEMKVTCIKETEPAPVALENIEYRIAIHMQGAYENMLEVGRCLNEAKEAGLVPVSYTHLDVYKRQVHARRVAAGSQHTDSLHLQAPL